MGLRRKLYAELLQWKETSRGKNALLIDGARRVGKSYLCSEFGKNEYKTMVFIDFAHTDAAIKELFEKESVDLDLFFIKIGAFYKVQLIERETLFVFDEVQLFPLARQLIKYLVADGRYDYIETGSLISLKKNVQDIVIPSEEKHIEMHPLDFEEFLWAMGDEGTVPLLKACFEKRLPLGQMLHRKVLNDFRQYILVGGMPQAVNSYIETKDFAVVDEVKRDILTLYRNDISKFARGYESRVKAIFDTIPGQLSKKEKKYMLSSISKDARYRAYEDAFMWLDDARVANPCFNATDPNVGLALSQDFSTQKIYMADTGLLVTHTFSDEKYTDNDLYRAVLFDKLNVNEGMLMENIAAQSFRANGRKLFFYSRAVGPTREEWMEIDFLVKKKQKICPVEVKSSSYRKHSSLDKFRTKFSAQIGDCYILYQKDVMVKDGVVHLPIYMAMFL